MNLSKDPNFSHSKTFHKIRIGSASLPKNYVISKKNKTTSPFYFHLYVGIFCGVVPYSFRVNETTGVKILCDASIIRKVK